MAAAAARCFTPPPTPPQSSRKETPTIRERPPSGGAAVLVRHAAPSTSLPSGDTSIDRRWSQRAASIAAGDAVGVRFRRCTRRPSALAGTDARTAIAEATDTNVAPVAAAIDPDAAVPREGPVARRCLRRPLTPPPATPHPLLPGGSNRRGPPPVPPTVPPPPPRERDMSGGCRRAWLAGSAATAGDTGEHGGSSRHGGANATTTDESAAARPGSAASPTDAPRMSTFGCRPRWRQ